ncbi:uncharacterized protein LOC18421815 isoform X1 [Amborella trichopoda]|nr:uncharacterized protein LOC18421815 isoform X1 [Amborella trichopoda]|eukprot:XP_006826675.2 uncharacterized protein LOC18421815 isoform X1 [Amborella trichopoda]
MVFENHSNTIFLILRMPSVREEDSSSSSSRETREGEDRAWRNTSINRRLEREQSPSRMWGALLIFGLIGTTYAVGQLRRTVYWLWSQMSRSQSYSSWKGATNNSSFREEAWKRYNRRMQEEYEEEMERVERIRRMQSVFNRERNKYKKSYESWRDYGPGAYRQYQRDDWYWKTDTSYKDQKAHSKTHPSDTGGASLSHHYSVLGLDRYRAQPYTEVEIKTAFRAKAKEYHPDQNQGNEEVAEEKFKEVMTSYEAIKSERKNGKA